MATEVLKSPVEPLIGARGWSWPVLTMSGGAEPGAARGLIELGEAPTVTTPLLGAELSVEAPPLAVVTAEELLAGEADVPAKEPPLRVITDDEPRD